MASLTIGCTLLLGSYQASDPFSDSATAEWPPHPYRLHAALVGAACELGGGLPADEDVEALRWLEAQGMPHIVCARQAQSRSAPDVYVPRNPVPAEIANSQSKWRREGKHLDPWLRNARKFPTAIPDEPTFFFTWDGIDSPPEAFDRLAAAISWLGSSRSPVTCWVSSDQPDKKDTAEWLAPAALGDHSIRVAAPGTTDALLSVRHVWPTPYQPPIATYAARPDDGRSSVQTQGKSADAGVFEGPLGELLIRPIAHTSHDLSHTALITSALRLAMLSKLGDRAPDCLHGHGEAQHAAFLALGDVAHQHANGSVRGVAIALPRSISLEERAIIASALASLDELGLGPKRGNLRLADAARPLISLRPDRWVKASTTYATVTPIVLDRFPKKPELLEDELWRTLANAGFGDVIESADVIRVPAVTGGPQHNRLLGDLPPGYRAHAIVKFKQPVKGPVVAGKGRFRGIGLLMPWGKG